MSKSGNYNLGEIEKRDALIQDLLISLKGMVGRFGGSATVQLDRDAVREARIAIEKAEASHA